MKIFRLFIAAALLAHIFSCGAKVTVDTPLVSYNSEETSVKETMQKHLDAISGRSMEGVKATIGGGESFELLLQGSEVLKGEQAFIDYHTEWFQDTTWTLDAKIISEEIGSELAAFTTEVMYREPDRDGEPYFNKMHVTYVLAERGGEWKVIKDHACSIEKSTDKK